MPRAYDLETKLHDYLVKVHAMEKSVLSRLRTLIQATADGALHSALERHREETERQIGRLEERFQAHYVEPSDVKDLTARFAAFFRTLAETLRDDKPVNHAIGLYVTEHLEIATYEILERLADSAGDAETAAVARQNRAEEETMARTIADSWDRLLEQMLAEERLLAQSTRRFTSGQASGGRPAT